MDDPELLAMQTDTCIISTAYDAYRAVRLIYHAMPISSICKNKDLVCFHLDDYIDDVQNTVLESRFRAYPILDEEERVVGTLSRYHLLRPRRKQVILMDHNEKAQSVPGLDQAEILEIIDHHRLADIQTKNPITVRNEPVGSTTTIVAGMYQDKGLMPTAKMAGLMAAAIVSDTVMFKSPTCTQRDIDIANRMSRIANVSLEELGQTIFSAATGEDKSAEAIIRTDYKEFHIGGHNLAVSQITCLDSDRLMARKEEFLATMETIRKKNGLDIVLLMITNVLVEGSYLLYSGDTETIRQAFNITGEEKNSVFLPKIMSRKSKLSRPSPPCGAEKNSPENRKSSPGRSGRGSSLSRLQALVFGQLAVFVGGIVGDLAQDGDLRRGLKRGRVLRQGGAHDGTVVGERVDVDLKPAALIDEAVLRLVDGVQARVALHQIADVLLLGDRLLRLPLAGVVVRFSV